MTIAAAACGSGGWRPVHHCAVRASTADQRQAKRNTPMASRESGERERVVGGADGGELREDRNAERGNSSGGVAWRRPSRLGRTVVCRGRYGCGRRGCGEQAAEAEREAERAQSGDGEHPRRIALVEQHIARQKDPGGAEVAHDPDRSGGWFVLDRGPEDLDGSGAGQRGEKDEAGGLVDQRD